MGEDKRGVWNNTKVSSRYNCVDERGRWYNFLHSVRHPFIHFSILCPLPTQDRGRTFHHLTGPQRQFAAQVLKCPSLTHTRSYSDLYFEGGCFRASIYNILLLTVLW